MLKSSRSDPIPQFSPKHQNFFLGTAENFSAIHACSRARMCVYKLLLGYLYQLESLLSKLLANINMLYRISRNVFKLLNNSFYIYKKKKLELNKKSRR